MTEIKDWMNIHEERKGKVGWSGSGNKRVIRIKKGPRDCGL